MLEPHRLPHLISERRKRTVTIDITELEQALLSEAVTRYILAVSEASNTLCMDDSAYKAAKKFIIELQRINTKICNA